MQSDASENREQIKTRLSELLKVAAGSIVVAAATLTTATADANTPAGVPNAALENRVNELRKQIVPPSTVVGDGDAEGSFVAFNNWGNHWNNWNNGWHNWHNWHNY
jgi:hypothetical protein